MKVGNRKKFLNQALLTEMLNLRRNGFSYNILAVMFGVDRTSLSFHCDRYEIKPEEVINFKGIVSTFLPKPEAPKWKIVNGDRYCI